MDDKRKVLYEQLSKDYDLGDFESFSSKLDDDNKRKAFYDAVSQDYDLGDYESFSQKLMKERATEPYTHEYGSDGSLIGGTALQEAGKPREVAPEVTERILANKPDYFKSPGQSLIDIPLGREPQKVELDVVKPMDSQFGRNYTANKVIDTINDVYSGVGYDYKAQKRIENAIEDSKNPEVVKSRTAWQMRGLANDVDALLEEAHGKLKKKAPVGGNAMNALMSSRQYGQDNASVRQEISKLDAAKRLLEQSQNVVDEAGKKGKTNFVAGTLRGFWDNLEGEDFTFGAADASSSASILNALEKVEEGKPLTDAEDALLKASAINMAVQYHYANDLGEGYKAGGVTAESVPFMLEMLINPIAGFGKASAKTLLNYGLKAFAKNAVKGLAKGAVAGVGMASTTGLGNVVSGMNERLAGNYDYMVDNEGKLHVDKKDEVMGSGEALARSFASRAIENQSEMIFRAFDGAGQLLKGVQKYIPGGVNKFFSDIAESKVGQLYKGIKNSPLRKELAEATQVGGIGEEYLEEVYNNLANFAIGEMEWEDVVSLDKNIETLLGLAPTQAMFAMLGLGGMGMQRYNNRKSINNAFGKMSEEQKAKLKELQEMGKLNGNKDIAEFIKITIADKSLTPEEKRAEIEYAYNLAKQNAINEVAEVETQDRVEADNASIDAATDTQTGNYAQVTAILPDGVGGTNEVVGNVVGWIGDSPIFVADGMENTEENRRVLKQGEWNPETLIARPAEEVKAINEDIIREEVSAQAERESKYAPEVLSRKMEQGIPFETADAIYLPIQPMAEGNGWTVEVQPKATNNKTASKSEVIELTNDEFYDLLQADLEAQETVQAEIAQSESVGEQVNAPVNTEVNNPMENAESTPMPEEVQSATEEKTTQPVIPTKKDGSIDFVAYGREGTLKTLGEKYGEKLPNKVAVTAKALAEDVVKAEEKLAKAEEAYDNAPIGREQKAEEARDKARQELEEVKKEADYWKAIDEEIKEAQKAREAIVNPTVEADMSNEPMTTEEFVAKALADGGIRLTSDSYKKELGYGEKERKRFPKMFAKKENGGLSIEEAGEWLMQWDSENGTNFFDQEDANAGRDALINFLGSVRTWGDITGYIRRNREQLAERESEGLRNEVENAIEANYHMTPEEYATLQEVESVENPFGGLDVATKDAIFVEAYEEYEQSLNPKQNDEGRTSEIAEGNGSVLSEERTDNEGRADERQGERPDVGEGAVQQNDAAQEAEQVEEPLTIQEGESPVAFAERVIEEQRRKPLRERAKEWSDALGVDVTIYESVDDIEDKAVRQQVIAIHNSKKLAPGWVTDGKVYFLMSDMADVDEIDNTYIHEVVAHIGMEKLLGKERFAELCDKVWEMMPQSAKDYFYNYPEVSNIKDETARRRKAADEYIAHLAEKENLTPEEQTIWDSIVKMFRDMLDRALNGIIGKSKLTDKDISDLIKASYANLKSGASESVSGEDTRFNAKRTSDRRQEINRMNNTVDQAVSFVTGKDIKEVKAERIEREQKRKEDAAEIYKSVLSGDFNDVTLRKINDYIDDATPLHPYGRRISQRLPQKLERGLHEGARTNAVDALFSRICESAIPASRRASEAGRREIEERKKEALKGWAIATNNWHTDLSDFADEEDFIRKGTDSKVYLAKDGRHVIKVSFGKPEGKRFRPDIDTTALFNSVFRNTAYEIVGYGEFDGKFARILKQPFVDFADKTALNAEEREEYMRTLGFEPINESNTAFSNGTIIAADLQKSNILKDAAGNISVIDADMKLHTKDVGGNYTYPPVEADLPNNTSFRVVKDKNGKKTLVGLHNISEDKLKKAIKQGGLANPSMAVIDMDKQSHVDYGDITLVAPESLVDKKLGKNIGTYMADAYTPIYPTVVKQMTDKGYKAFNNALDDVNEVFRSKVRSYFKSYLDSGTVYDALYYWYLSDTGKNPPTLEAALPSDFTREEVDKVKSINPEADSFFQLSEEDKQKALAVYADKFYGGIEKYQEYLADYINRMREVVKDESKPAMVRNRIQRNLNEVENYGFEYDYVAAYYNRGMTLASRQSKPSDVETFSNARNEVIKKGLTDEFKQWLAEKEADLGVEEKLFKGYDNQGRAKYVPNTLENASKLMKKEGRAGATGYGGFNEFVAVLAPVAKTTKELNKKKQNLSTKEAYDEFVEQWSGHYHDLAQKLQPGADKWADYGYHRLQEIAPMANPRDYVKREYGIELSDEFMKDLNDIKTAIENDFPARYFETKFERPVYLNEFAAAVVPQGTSEDVVSALKSSGLPVEEYERGNNEARMAAVDKVSSEIEGIRFRVKSFETANEELDKEGISINNKELMDEYGLSDITLSKSGNHVTLSKVVVEDKGKGNGTRFMEDLTNNADNNGWILALTPDTSFGGSSVARLKKFYKRFGFKDNKGRNTDFETRESMVRPVGGTRFRISNQNQEIFAHEPAIDYVSQANDVVEVPKDEVMYTMNNIASQLYKTSGRFMRQLYQNGTLGRVLKGDYAEIDQIKAKNEYDHAKPILDEYLNELIWMKYQATDAAQEVINDVISDVEYAIKYYKDLSLGKDVWRTEERPRFRIVEKQHEDVNKGVDSFTSKYNSKPVSVASSDMTDEELEKAVPTSLVEDTRKAIEEGVNGKYSVKADKIYIFADNVTKEELEDTLFHENLHPMFSGNPIIEEFYANFNAKYPEQVKMLAEGYEESEVPEEVFVTNLAVGMQRGNFKMVEPFLAESSREDLYNTLKAFGYDYEQERGRRNPERNSGKGSDVAEGKKVANRSRGKEDSEGQRESSREQAEKLRDLFGRVADMGLDGVLGNEAYDRAMMDIYSVLPEDSRKEVIDDAFNHYGMNIAPAVSDYIHGKSDGNILDKIVAIIRNALRKVGFDIDLNGNEVKYLAWRSKKPLDRSNLVDMAEDIYKKYQLKVGEYSTNDDGTTPDGGGTRFKVKETKKERIADLRAEISDLKREVTNARKNSQEEWEANQRAIISFIKGKLTKEAGEEFGKYRIDQLLNLVNKATTAKDLSKPFQFIEQVINSAIMDREAARMEKLIKTKLQGETSRGVAKGVVVDESTRRLFDSIRGTFKDLISTSIDSELRHVRSEILRFGKEINDLPADDIQGRTILTARQEALKERRKELEAEQEELRKNNVVETKESLKKRYDELVDAMDAHIDGKGAWTIEMQDEYDSIPLREKLAEIREAQAQLDDILTDALNTRRAAYGLKGGERKKMLAEADILDSNYSIAQEELIRLMSEVSRDLEEIIKEGKSRLASRREALDERRRKIVSMGIGAVKDRKVIAPNAALTKEEKWHKWFDNSGLKKFTDFMTAPLNSFNFLLKYIDRNHTIGEGELYNYFMKSQEGALEANNRLYDGLKAYNTAIEEKAKEIFGKSIEKVMKDSGKEYNDRVTKQYMFDSTSHREGERYPIRISKGQALYVWLTWRQEDGRAKLLADGWTEESIAEIEDLIGGDYMKFGEWITDEFFPQLREEKYNKTHIEMFGTSMAKREHYFPFKVNAEDIQEKGEMGESYEGMPSTITGNIIKRTINKSRINTEQNAFDLLYKYGNDMETWNAMAKLRQDLNFLHASKAFRNYMEANSKGLFNTFMKAAEVAVKAYNNSAEANPINDFFVKLNRMWAGSNIGFRLNTAMKQILSYPAFMAYSGNPKFQINLGKYMLNWKGNYDWAKENLPAFRQRIETGDMGMTGMTDPQFDFAKYFKKFTDAGMIPNQLVDALTCAAGARSVYDFEYNQAIKNGLSEEEAKNVAQYNAEVAFNETQQSSREEFVSPIQMSRNVLIKSMMNYQNSNVGYQRMGNEGLLEIMRAKRVYEQDLKNGMNEAEAKKKMANSIARGTRKAMVAFTILPGLWYLGGRGIVGITAPLISSLFGGGGDDEPYLDDEAKVGLLVSIGLGTVAGTAGGQLIGGLVQGREYNPMAWMNEMQKDIVGAVNNGWNMNTTKNIALRLAKFGGVNMETWENIYLGAEHAIRTGNFDLVDFMMLINLPASQRKAMAEELYSDMPFMEYADKVSRAQKLFDDYRKYLPYAKTDKNGSKSNAIKKQYIIENLSEEKQDKLEKEKEFKKLQREYGQAEDKAEWLEEHPEYTELEKNFKLQTVTKEVNREAKKLK